jgi:hypothetical protein
MKLFHFALAAILLPAWASAQPTTQPTTTDSVTSRASAKLAMLGWHIEDWTSAEAQKAYHATTDEQKKLAQAMSEQLVAEAKLQKAVRDKWGKDAEATFAHLIGGTTHEDDQAATETGDGDHAIIHWSVDGVGPMFMVRVNNQWKIDVTVYAHNIGSALQRYLRYSEQSTTVYEDAIEALSKNVYTNAEQLANYVKGELEKIDPDSK